MDGFHLRNEVLDARGLRAVKGAPETFDVEGYVTGLRSVRMNPQHTVHWPAFDRAIEEPVPGAIEIAPATKLVITEGNYLLLDQPGWRDVRPLLDEVWYVDAPPREVLRHRLIERQLAGGRTKEEAMRHVDESDLANAEQVARTKTLANRWIRLS
jgi:pantothenate kinase